jgi:putative protein-disulfide isomerase
MTTRLLYLYDPMCGWCYGASPGIAKLAREAQVEPLPTGLFAEDTRRRIDPAFAQHIAQADARIEAMSGQPFSEAYRRDVLGRPGLPFHSRTASEALTAVAQVDAGAELDALHAIQRERYVHGRDITDAAVLAAALADAVGGSTELWRERLAEPSLPAATDERFARARQLMQRVGAQGVPTLLQVADGGVRVLPSQVLFG